MAAYQLTSAHLSYARAAYGDPGLVANLTRLVADAHSVIYGSRTRSLAAVGRFFSACSRITPIVNWGTSCLALRTRSVDIV